jgi:hypothetical protein
MGRTQVSDLQHIYNKLLFDTINEALGKVVGAGSVPAPVWLAHGRPPSWPLAGPPTGAALLRRVQQFMRQWSETNCGDDQKEIDALLAVEMRADTLTWMQCEEEESFLKFELADSIFSDLLADTVAAVQTLRDRPTR